MIRTALAPAGAGSSDATPPAGAPGVVAWYAESFSDALGDRLRLFDNASAPFELLRFRASVTAAPGFEAAVRARVEALSAFNHPSFAKVRTLTVLDDPQPQLALVSALVMGERLSAVLRAAQARGVRLDPTCAIWLLRQLLPALSALHDATRGARHRLLDADRVVVTPDGELAITEYVFGGLPDDLVPAPRTTDVGQAALLAVAVIRGYPLRPGEYSGDFSRIVQDACTTSPSADVLRPWLMRALAPDPHAFESPHAAYLALGELLPGVWGHAPAARQLPDGRATAPMIRSTPPAPPAAASRALPPAPAARDSKPSHGPRRVNRALAAVAALEAVCIVVLVAVVVRSASSPPARPAAAVAVQSAGVVPVRPAAPGPAQAAPPGAAAAARPALAGAAPAPRGVAPSSVIGSLRVESPIAVKVYLNGRLLGEATARRFGVPAGDHTITLVNDMMNFRSSQPVRIVAGRSVLVTATPE